MHKQRCRHGNIMTHFLLSWHTTHSLLSCSCSNWWSKCGLVAFVFPCSALGTRRERKFNAELYNDSCAWLLSLSVSSLESSFSEGSAFSCSLFWLVHIESSSISKLVHIECNTYFIWTQRFAKQCIIWVWYFILAYIIHVPSIKPACASKGMSCKNWIILYRRHKIPLNIDSAKDITSSQLRPTKNTHMLMAYTNPSGISFSANQMPDPTNVMKFFNISGKLEIQCIILIIIMQTVSTVNNRNSYIPKQMFFVISHQLHTVLINHSITDPTALAIYRPLFFTSNRKMQ